MSHYQRTLCRVCGSPLERILNLGEQYLASRFPLPDEYTAEPGPFPLVLTRCASAHGCGLVQLEHTVDPALMYSQYGYLSGINESMQAHLESIASTAESWVLLDAASTVVDIGCNDGTLLNSYRLRDDMRRIGFEPASNAGEIARRSGIRVIDTFFGDEHSVELLDGQVADVVTSIAMFYDLEDPQQFVNSVARILAQHGVWILEMSYLPMMLEMKSLDTICHEHLEYYALRQIDWMLKRAELVILDATLNDVNGGSIQLVIGHIDDWSGRAVDTSRIDKLRTREQRLQLHKPDPYDAFAAACVAIREPVTDAIRQFNEAGAKVAGYGASTKGNTLLQYCGLGPEMITYIADRNPWKSDRLTPGTRIPIVGEDRFREDVPDVALVLPWHFIKGFLARERDYLSRGGTFMVPIPELRLFRSGDL